MVWLPIFCSQRDLVVAEGRLLGQKAAAVGVDEPASERKGVARHSTFGRRSAHMVSYLKGATALSRKV
jgi:hypothetical protein